MDKRTAEQILELKGVYTVTDLRRQFYRLAKEFHPDSQGGNEAAKAVADEYMKEINEAHTYLRDLFSGGVESLVAEAPKSNQNAESGQGFRQQQAAQNPWQTNASSKTSAANTSNNPSSAAHPHGQTTKASPSSGPGQSAAQTEAREAADQAYRRTAAKEKAPKEKQSTPKGYVAAFADAEDASAASRSSGSSIGILYRIVSHIPLRIIFFVVIALLFISPAHAGIDYITHFGTFEWVLLYQGDFGDFLIWHGLLILAIVNLFFPVVTEPIRSFLLFIADKLHFLWLRFARK